MRNNSNIIKAAQFIKDADSIIVAAGAGMGVDSGLPDFRGNEGFWRAYPALAQANIQFSSIASPAAFEENIRRAWGFYGHRLNLYRHTTPHAGFALLKKWGEQKPNRYSIFTSNVDGQFQQAGFDPQAIHECHGSIHHLQCLEPCCGAIWPADSFTPNVNNNSELTNELPLCMYCGGYARPNILMFNDSDWINSRTNTQRLQQMQWLTKTKNPVVIELGAGIDIPTVRYFSQSITRRFNGRLIRINPREHDVDSSEDIGIADNALPTLSAIDRLLNVK